MHRLTRFRALTALSLLGLVLSAGRLEAQARPGTTARNTDRLAVVKSAVHVLDAADASLLEPPPDGASLVFGGRTRRLDRVAGGDVIVVGVTPSTPQGLLRRVVRVVESPSEVVFVTEPATIEDVFWSVRATERVRMFDVDVQRLIPMSEGVSISPRSTLSFSPGPIAVDLVDVVLYDMDGNPVTRDDQVTVTGSVGVTPTFDIDLDLKWGRVKKFSFTNTNDLFTKLELEGRVPVFGFDENVTVATIQFAPITIPAGPVPLVFTPVLDIKVGVAGDVTAGLRTSVAASVPIAAGVVYENGRWRGFTDLPDSLDDITLTWERPEFFVEAAVQVYAGPKFSFLLYGVAGPFAAAYGYAELAGEIFPDVGLALFIGVRGQVGVEAKIPIIGVGVSYTHPVFNQRWRVAGAPF